MNCIATYRLIIVVTLVTLFSRAFSQNIANHVFREDSALQKAVAINRAARYDSVARLMEGTPDDSLKVKRLIYLYLYAVGAQRDTVTLSRAEKLAEKLRYYPGLATSYSRIGDFCQEQYKFSTAVDYYLKAIAIDEAHQCYPQIFEHFASMLNVFFLMGDFPEALKFTQRASSIAEKTGNTGMVANYNSLFGFIYLREGNFEESRKYYNRYFNLCLGFGDSLMIADAYNCLGDVYAGLRQYGYALGAFNKAAHIYYNTVNVKVFYGGATRKQHERLAYTLFKISSTYACKGNYTIALQYADSVFKYGNATICNKYDLAAYYINTANIYNHFKNYSNALSMLDNGLALAKQIRHREDTRDAYAALAETYAALHKFDSAYVFSTLYGKLKDSIVNEESLMKIAAIQADYDNEKRNLDETRHNLVRNITIAAIALLVTILFLSYSRYLLKQKHKYQRQVNKQQGELFDAVVAAQDNERKRIAQDIHDSLGSVLSAAKLGLSSLGDDKTLFSPQQTQTYQSVLGLLDDASSELRDISHNLMPATLLKLGLVPALQNLFDRMSSTGLRIHFTTHGVKERLGEAMEISIYRITLELLNNIVKHAAASAVTVQLVKHPNYINITIEDNGIGFNYQQTAAETSGMGIGNILSRVGYLKGSLDVDSGKGTGTTVIIDIPLDDSTNGMV